MQTLARLLVHRQKKLISDTLDNMSSILVYCTLSVLDPFLIYKGEWFKRGVGEGRKAVNSMCLSSPHMKKGERQVLI